MSRGRATRALVAGGTHLLDVAHSSTRGSSRHDRDGATRVSDRGVGDTMRLLEPSVTDWLLDSDPALRWQVERDILNAAPDVWRATRSTVATTGFGARLLALQDADGQWAGGAYFPAHTDADTASESGQPWIATTWSLKFLREWGVDATVLTDTADRLATNCRWEYNDLPYWGGEVDCCIDGFTLANGAWLGADVSGIATWFVEHQMPEGGWNCDWVEGSTRSSFHSTLNALAGILTFRRNGHDATGLDDAQRRAEEYLLARQLLYRASDGALAGPWVTELAFPPFWVYNVLSALDYFRERSQLSGFAPDPRLARAIEAVRAQRQPDGTWYQAGRPEGRLWFETDVEAGRPSKWLTLQALRVLTWWDEASAPSEPAAHTGRSPGDPTT